MPFHKKKKKKVVNSYFDEKCSSNQLLSVSWQDPCSKAVKEVPMTFILSRLLVLQTSKMTFEVICFFFSADHIRFIDLSHRPLIISRISVSVSYIYIYIYMCNSQWLPDKWHFIFSDSRATTHEAGIHETIPLCPLQLLCQLHRVFKTYLIFESNYCTLQT